MKVSAAFHLNPQFHLPKHPHKPIVALPKLPSRSSSTLINLKQNPSSITTFPLPSLRQCIKTLRQDKKQQISELVHVPKWLILGSASLGLLLLLLFAGFEGQEAMALGPEGPIVEEFWDNMRRYGLYVLTVSTGAIYTILLPIVELLKNPISALILVGVLVGGFYLVSLVLGAMTGISDFSYDYSY